MVFLERTNDTSVRWWQVEDIEVVQNLSVPLNLRLFFHLSGHVTGAADLKLVATFQPSSEYSHLLTVAANIGCRRIVLLASLEEPEPVIPMPLLLLPTQLLSGLVAPMVVCFISSIRHL